MEVFSIILSRTMIVFLVLPEKSEPVPESDWAKLQIIDATCFLSQSHTSLQPFLNSVTSFSEARQL